jgi:FkbM family methyltransferase
MVVVDVGANVGMYTLIAARAVGQSGRVIAFEPTPRTFAILKDNIQINGLLETGRVELHDVAITDRMGTARFGVHAANSGHNTLFPEGDDVRVIDVPTTSLDIVLADEARVDVVKIDAEGAEPLIWAGMSGVLTRSPGIRVFLEFAPGLLQRGGYDPAAFLARIERDGFEVQVVDDGSGALRTGTYAKLRDVASANLMLTRKRP